MKANELMNGDLIRYGVNSNLCKFVIDSRGAYLERISDNSQYLPCCEVEPIPLTEEIFKANGFVQINTTIGNYALRLHKKDVFDISTMLWGGVFDGRIEVEVLKEYALVKKKCCYVHELQHTLRLCGLNELADKFKLKKERKEEA